MARDYPDPWVPRTFSTWIVKASTFQRTGDRSKGQVHATPRLLGCERQSRRCPMAETVSEGRPGAGLEGTT